MIKPHARPLATPKSEQYDGSYELFMSNHTMAAAGDKNLIKVRHDGRLGRTSGKVVHFKDTSTIMAARGLEGSAVLGVISEKGAWFIHVWERPSLRNGPYLIRDVFKCISEGDATPDPEGLPWVPDLSDMVGPGQMFSNEYKPRIFSLGRWDGNPSANTGQDGYYPRQMGQGRLALQDILGGNRPEVVAAHNDTFYTDDQATSISLTEETKLILTYTPAQTIAPNGLQTAKVAMYRAHSSEPVFELDWHAHPEQLVTF